MPTTVFTHEATDEALEIALAALDDGDTDTARVALEYALNDLNMNHRNALESQLIHLMMHIIKWRIQPERRSGSWAGSVFSARLEIARIQRDKPSLNRRFVESLWESCLSTAIRQAEAETGINIDRATTLTWHEVFEEEYRILH